MFRRFTVGAYGIRPSPIRHTYTSGAECVKACAWGKADLPLT